VREEPWHSRWPAKDTDGPMDRKDGNRVGRGENQSYRAEVKRIRRVEKENKETNCVCEDFINRDGEKEEGKQQLCARKEGGIGREWGEGTANEEVRYRI
jgi:hypothetical protein